MLVPYQQQYDPHIECPHCHRHSIVKHGESEYVCLNCDFRRDLAEPHLGRFGNLLMGLLAFALALMVGELLNG